MKLYANCTLSYRIIGIYLQHHTAYILIKVPRVFLLGIVGTIFVSVSFGMPPFRFNCFSMIRALLA